MTGDFEDEYLYKEKAHSHVQGFASAPGIATYDAKDIRPFLKDELKGHMQFNSDNVLRRLGVDKVNANVVQDCVDRLNTHDAESKKTLLELVALADRRTPKEVDDEEREMEQDAKKEKVNYKEISGRRERLMMKPLHSIFEMIRGSAPSTFRREWVSVKDSRLKSEGDTFSFPEIIPDFTVCEAVGPRNQTFEVTHGKRLWRRRLAFVELKASSTQGIQVANTNPPSATDFTAQAADYARLHMSAKPFQVYSIGLLIFGRNFCVAIFDRDGVEFSPVTDMWTEFDVFVRVIRRLSCDMNPYDLGMDPNVGELPLEDPFSKACHLYSQEMIPANHRSPTAEIERLAKYPTYSIRFGDKTYYTIGLPIWSSLSLMGRGTTIWKVTDSPDSNVAASLSIMKSAWRKSNRSPESLIYEHVKAKKIHLEREQKLSGALPTSFGRSEGLVEYSSGGDASLLDSRKLTAANLRGLTSQENTTVLHRVFFKSIGRSLWEFDNFLEFFLGVRAALAGHKFLADANILHRDISVGNILLPANSDGDIPDEKRGFLTDFEFARIEDEHLEAQKTIAVPPVRTPEGTLTPPTTRTHTTWSSVQRGAPMTGTVQFMACGLVHAMSLNQTMRHELCHDIESFVWVIYYATLRRLAYVERPLQDVNIPKEATTVINEGLKNSFKRLFGHVDLKKVSYARVSGEVPVMMFGLQLLKLLSPPLVQFFHDLQDYVDIDTRRTKRSIAHPFGQATYDGLIRILDQAITGLRQINQY